MTCSHPFPDHFPLDGSGLDVDAELFVRHLLGHRRLTDDLIEAIAMRLGTDHFHNTYWMWDLLNGDPLPFAEVAFDVLPGIPSHDGPERWAITKETCAAVDEWIATGDPAAPIGASTEFRKAIVLLLWGHGCGVSADPNWRKSTARREALERFFPDLPVLVNALIDTNVAGLDRHIILTTLTTLQNVGGFEAFELDGRQLKEQNVGGFLRQARDKGVICGVAPAKIARSSAVARIPHERVPVLRSALMKCILGPDSTSFARAQLGRPVNRKKVGLRRAASTQGAAEIEALAVVHRTIGSVMAHHPGCVDRSASVYPINEIPIYREGVYRAGHPSGVHLREPDGSLNPRVRSATRTPDGAIWTTLDAPDEPAILIEHEESPKNLHLEAHLETALWVSARWRKTISLIIVTTPQSHRSVRNAVNMFVIDNIAERFHLDWPKAEVDITLVKEKSLKDHCPLHGDDAEYVVLRADPAYSRPRSQ